MPEVASLDQQLLDQIDAALRQFERPTPEFDPDPECSVSNRGKRWLLTLFACLTVIYHADHAMAQVIEGETSDGNVYVSWEYDLEFGMGHVLFRNIDVPLEGWNARLYLAGLVPEDAQNLRPYSLFDGCPGSGAPPHLVLARLDPGNEATIEFDFCRTRDQSGVSLPPCSLIEAAEQEVEYGLAYRWSGACFFSPKGSLADFVSVRPMDCSNSDRDKDSDVDLRDFADFQANTAPEQLPCFDLFYDEMTGPR